MESDVDPGNLPDLNSKRAFIQRFVLVQQAERRLNVFYCHIKLAH